MGTLSDKRKETLDNLLEMTKSSSQKEEWHTVFRETFSIIEQQDREFIKELLTEIDHLNEKFEAIAMRANIETMVGDAILGAGE